MAKTFERLCVEDVHYSEYPTSGKILEKGETYLTSQVWDDNTVTVFTEYWVKVDVEVFSLERDNHFQLKKITNLSKEKIRES